MSRINLLLALGGRIESLNEVIPQVYQTDSILLPDPLLGQQQIHHQGDIRRLPLTVGDIDVPAGIATLEGLRRLRANIETGLRNKRASDTWKIRMKVDLVELGISQQEIPTTLDAAVRIYELLRKLHDEAKDGVWARIIEQAFAAATIEKVDLVIGNPPWISWKNLPRPWQDRSKVVWEQWGLWATQQRGGGIPLADIATLMFARSLVSYASSNGVVAFLLPESLLIADPGNEKIRRCMLAPKESPSAGTPFRPIAVDDWTQVQPFSPDASNRPVAVYAQAGESPKWPIDKTVWNRQARALLSSDRRWSEVSGSLSSEEIKISPVEASDWGSPWVENTGLPLYPKRYEGARYTWGRGFDTRGVDGWYTFEILSERPHNGLVLVRNVPSAGRNTNDQEPREGQIEASFLWPLVRGRDVHRFRVDQSGHYALLPHDPDDPRKVLTKEEMIQIGPHLFDFLEPWLERLRKRSPYGRIQPTDDKPWGVLGPAEHLRRDGIVVLCRYIHPRTRPPCAVAFPEYDPKLGMTTVCYPNNKSNIHVTGDAVEARYLAGWINSHPAQLAISRLASSITIAPNTLHRLPIPRFDSHDDCHQRIAEIARIYESGENDLANELDKLVARIALESRRSSD